MILIKKSDINEDTLFNLNGLDYNKGIYTLYYDNKVLTSSGDIDTTKIRIGIRSKSQATDVLITPKLVNSYTKDGTTSYSNFDELILDLSDLLCFKNGGGLGNGIVITDVPSISLDFNTEQNGVTPNTLNGDTWSIVNGKLINTPIETPFTVLDSSLENWNDINTLSDWQQYIPSSGSIEQSSDAHTGTYSAKIISQGDRIDIKQNVLVPVGKFYNARAYAKSNPPNKYLRFINDNQLLRTSNNELSDSYTEIINSSFRKTASGLLMIQNLGNSGVEFNVDDITVSVCETKTVFATTDYIGNLTQVKAYTKPRIGSFSGVAINIDNPENPQNYISLLKNGGNDNVLYLWKMVNGVMTQIATHIVDDYYSELLIEIRQEEETVYQIYVNGSKSGSSYTIDEPTINKNGYHGLISPISDNVFEYFSCSTNNDIVNVPNGADLKKYIKYLSSGDVFNLAYKGVYTLNSADNGFENVPNGTANNHTIINGNNATIEDGNVSIKLNNKEYLQINDLKIFNANILFCHTTGTTKFIEFNRVIATSNKTTLVDCFKNQVDGVGNAPTDLTFNDCIAYLSTDTGVLTVDGFEDWGSKRITYNRCIAFGFKNGVSGYNNGHGFETYSGDGTEDEHCEDITYNECIAYDNRVGFSAEGGVPQISGINIKAINCIGYDNEIADAGGVNGSSINITTGTLLNRYGSVNEL